MGSFITFLLSGLKRIFLGPALLILEGIWYLIKWFFAGSAWMFMILRSYTIVTTIIKFVHYPIMISIMLILLSYLFNGMEFSFLQGMTIKEFLLNMIDTYPFLQRFIYVGYQVGIWQALSILFYFYLIRFALNLLLKMFSRVGL